MPNSTNTLYLKITPQKDDKDQCLPLEEARFFYIKCLIVSSSEKAIQKLKGASKSYHKLSKSEYKLNSEDPSILEEVQDYTVIKRVTETILYEMSKDLKEEGFVYEDLKDIVEEWDEKELTFFNNYPAFTYSQAIVTSPTTLALIEELDKISASPSDEDIDKLIETLSILDMFWD